MLTLKYQHHYFSLCKTMLKPSPTSQWRNSDFGHDEKMIQALALRLCPGMLKRHLMKQDFFPDNVVRFPIWRLYYQEARKITQLRQMFPLTQYCPLIICRWICALIFE